MSTERFIIRLSHSRMINYAYILKSPHGACLIDPALEKDKIDAIINENKITISGVLLTHVHEDHTNLADYYGKMFNCPVLMSKPEVEFYQFNCTNLKTFEDKEPITIAGMTITPLVTPGHTIGSACFLESDCLYTGDTLFIEGCGLCWGKGADPKKMFSSLQRLKKEIPDHISIYPGHIYFAEAGKNFEYVKNNNIYLDFEDEEKFVAYRMRPNQKSILSFK